MSLICYSSAQRFALDYYLAKTFATAKVLLFFELCKLFSNYFAFLLNGHKKTGQCPVCMTVR